MSTRSSYKPDFEEWKSKVSLYWPKLVATGASHAYIIPRLLETQDKFLAILILSDRDPFGWAKILQNTCLGGNVFLKHLMVLADVGSEQLQRLKQKFPFGTKLEFLWKNNEYKYKFKKINTDQVGKLTNKELQVHDLSMAQPLTPLQKDVAMILLFGGLVKDLPSDFEWLGDKCTIGDLLGDEPRLRDYIKQRYIWVSRITQGSSANALGQAFQKAVFEYLKGKLSSEWQITQNGTIPGVEDAGKEIRFDIVLKHSTRDFYCAVEVSFQVTTNSTIERKAGQAQRRHDLLKEKGYKIAYVLDGAGNIARQSTVAGFHSTVIVQ